MDLKLYTFIPSPFLCRPQHNSFGLHLDTECDEMYELFIICKSVNLLYDMFVFIEQREARDNLSALLRLNTL